MEWTPSLGLPSSLPLFLTAARGKYNIQQGPCVPLLPALSRKGTDGRNLCPSPSLGALALGRGAAGAEIHPGSTNFSQNLDQRTTAGARQGGVQERAGSGGGGEKERGPSLCATLAFPPRSPQGACITSAQFCNEWTLAPASKVRKLRLREGQEGLQVHPAGNWLHCQKGLSVCKNCPCHQTPCLQASLHPPSRGPSGVTGERDQETEAPVLRG